MAKKKKTYKELMEELQEVLRALEEGERSIEEDLVQYEKGTHLLKEMEGILNAADARIRILESGKEEDFL